ncbi:MAG: hypothetical protein ACN4GW_01560 [Desulforhopalus sp.]
MKVKYTIAAFTLLPIIAVIARNKVISSIFIVAWILVIPVCGFYILDWYRAADRDSDISELERNILRIPIALLGAISTIIGTAIFIWGFYDLFVEEHLQYTGLPTMIGGLGAGAIFIALGVYLIHLALTKTFKKDIEKP